MKLKHVPEIIGVILVTGGLIWTATAFLQRSRPHETSNTKSGSALRTLRVQLKWLHQAQFAGFYVAKEKGYFATHGLDVTLMQGGPANNALTAVVSGAADVGVWGSEQVLINRSMGKLVTAIGVVYQQSPACWMVRDESPIRSLRDLTTQTIGIQAQGTDFDILYRATMDHLHVDRSRLKERQVDFTLGLFASGQVDVWPSYVTNEPFIMDSQNIKVRCISPADSGIDFYGDTILVSDATLRTRERDLREFMWATADGWNYALGHAEEAVDMTLKWNKDLARPSQVHLLQQSINLIRPHGESHLLRMTAARWSRMQEILLKLGLIQHPIDVDTVFTNSLLPIP